MNHLIVATFVVTLAILQAAPAAAESILRPFEAVYTIRISVVRGESRVSLRQESDGTYVYQSHTEPKGLIGMFVRGDIREESRFRVDGDRIVPLHYERTDTISEDRRDLVIEFDWNSGTATRRFDDNVQQIELDDSAIDPGLLPIVVLHDLARGVAPGPYTLVERDQADQIDVRAEGDELVDTRAGDFNAVRFSHTASEHGRTTRIWAAPELGHMMVQMAQYSGDRERAKLTLKGVEFSE